MIVIYYEVGTLVYQHRCDCGSHSREVPENKRLCSVIARLSQDYPFINNRDRYTQRIRVSQLAIHRC